MAFASMWKKAVRPEWSLLGRWAVSLPETLTTIPISIWTLLHGFLTGGWNNLVTRTLRPLNSPSRMPA